MLFRQLIRPLLLCLTIVSCCSAESPEASDNAPRTPWTTSRMVGSPDPPSPYKLTNAFPNLKFDEPVDITHVPGTNRLVVVERFGKLYTFENDPNTTTRDLFLDATKAFKTEKGAQVFGIAFHPRFQENGRFFVTFRKPGELPTGVSRFEVKKGNGLQADPDSETVVIRWPGGHDGGSVKFGPDGYLYVSNGDQGGLHDRHEVGQGIADLQASILRIDVDGSQGEQNYRIPKDNPFVDTPGARGEVWAYGLRNPWRISFDRETGQLWTADVGEDLWESVHLVKRGGNYGWSVEEGGHPFRPARKRGPTPIERPIVAHDHSEARSITGGIVYRGAKLTELIGHYIYGDYDTGKVWTVAYDGKEVTSHREIVDSNIRLVAFGEDAKGEMLLVDHIGGQIYQLRVNQVEDTSANFPRKLSETGIFASAKDLVPADGMIPYDVIVPQWTDGATKERLIGLPGNSAIEFEAVKFPFRGGRDGWKFPDGAILVQTLSLQMEQGNPASSRRLETRIMQHERLSGPEHVGDQFWRFYTYVWNDEQTDATLLENPQGTKRTFQIKDTKAENGIRQQTWHFPGRTECSICHNMAAKYVLGCQTLQLNRARVSTDENAADENQIAFLQRIKAFNKPLPKATEELPSLTNVHDESAKIEDRARSYLHANCSHCHRNGGGGNADFFALASIDLKATKMMDKAPSHSHFYIPEAAIVKPGLPTKSLLYYRMNSLGAGRMPRLGSTMVDQAGIELIHRWIANLASPEQDSSSPKLKNISTLLKSTEGALSVVRAIDQRKLQPERVDAIVAEALKQEAPIRDLFEKYLPEQERTQRLGTNINPQHILALEGDIKQGRHLFLKQSGVQCRSCHRVDGQGDAIGPDLDKIGSKYTPLQILTSILEPSRNIDAKYLQYNCITAEGKSYSGIVVEKNDQVVVLKDAKGKVVTIPAADIELLTAQTKSMMPDLLVRDLTAQQVADLTAFLHSLK